MNKRFLQIRKKFFKVVIVHAFQRLYRNLDYDRDQRKSVKAKAKYLYLNEHTSGAFLIERTFKPGCSTNTLGGPPMYATWVKSRIGW